jgi:predicted nucleotidyltransferase
MIRNAPLPKNVVHLLPEALECFRSEEDIIFAYLFGSLSSGRVGPLSDVDVAGHVISDSGFRTPISYSDTFKVLHENGVLPAELFAKMDKMAKFRNISVHHYDGIDAEIVVEILKRDLDDLLSFQAAIISFLKKDNQEEGHS